MIYKKQCRGEELMVIKYSKSCFVCLYQTNNELKSQVWSLWICCSNSLTAVEREEIILDNPVVLVNPAFSLMGESTTLMGVSLMEGKEWSSFSTFSA